MFYHSSFLMQKVLIFTNYLQSKHTDTMYNLLIRSLNTVITLTLVNSFKLSAFKNIMYFINNTNLYHELGL